MADLAGGTRSRKMADRIIALQCHVAWARQRFKESLLHTCLIGETDFGRAACAILEADQQLRLTVVDHWSACEDRDAWWEKGLYVEPTRERRCRSLQELERRLKPHRARSEVFVRMSPEAATYFPDDHFHLIVLNGDCRYECCLSDSHAWYEKLHDGGRLCWWTCGKMPCVMGWCRVKDAARYFTGELDVELHEDNEWMYWIEKGRE